LRLTGSGIATVVTFGESVDSVIVMVPAAGLVPRARLAAAAKPQPPTTAATTATESARRIPER
jgi:hypothetical protein